MLILGILSQRLFSPIGSTGNMDTVPKSDRNRQWKIGVRYQMSGIARNRSIHFYPTVLLLPAYRGLHKRRTHAGATRAQVYGTRE